jgi:hypothetical protein
VVTGTAVLYDSDTGQSWVVVLVRAPGPPAADRGHAVLLEGPDHPAGRGQVRQPRRWSDLARDLREPLQLPPRPVDRPQRSTPGKRVRSAVGLRGLLGALIVWDAVYSREGGDIVDFAEA